jgi:hypothetical protein
MKPRLLALCASLVLPGCGSESPASTSSASTAGDSGPGDGAAPVDGVAPDVGDAGASDALETVDGRSDAGRTRDPRCPPTVPAEGATCSPVPAPLGCEYGGDAFGRCTTMASCSASSGSGPFAFHLSTSASCGANAADCPSSFGAVPEGGTCSTDGLSCRYDEGVCGCSCGGSARTWSCRTWSDVGSSVNVVPPPSPLPACPTHRPLVGDACPVEGQRCDYATYCRPATSLGPSLMCANGYWEFMPNSGACVMPTCGD